MTAPLAAPQALRVVLFDAVGTLIVPRPAAPDVYYRAGRQAGSRLSLTEVDQRFHAALGDMTAADRLTDWTTSPAQEAERWRRIVADVFVDVPAADTMIFPLLWEHFARPENWSVQPDVPSLWQRLAERGLRVGIASNFDDRLISICRHLPPLSSADCVFHSAELGARKPGPRFFAAIQQRLRLPAGALLLVGDDLRADYHGALEAGWQAVWLDRSGRGDPSCERSITQLAELNL